jgi:hypothetical protein
VLRLVDPHRGVRLDGDARASLEAILFLRLDHGWRFDGSVFEEVKALAALSSQLCFAGCIAPYHVRWDSQDTFSAL